MLAPRARICEKAAWPGVSRKVTLVAVFQANLIGADVLGDAAVLAAGHVGLAQRVQQAGLAVVDVTHDRDDRGPRLQVIVDVLGADEAFFDVGFRHAAHGVTEFGRHQLGGVVVDDVVDLQHHALTHQELDDLDTAHGHPVGQLLHGDDVGNDDFAADLDHLGGTAAALFLFTFTGPANRGQRAHAVGGVSIAGHGLDGQAAFAANRSALGARHGLAGGGGLAAIVVLLGRRLTSPPGRGAERMARWTSGVAGAAAGAPGRGPAADRRDPDGRRAPGAGPGPNSGRSGSDGRLADDRLADDRPEDGRLADDRCGSRLRDADRADAAASGRGRALVIGAVRARGALVERPVALRTIALRGRSPAAGR
jgi:hypothetical protein